MLQEAPGRCRPIEQCARRHGYLIETGGDDLMEARWYPVGDRVLILVPGWARGRAIREGMIARQVWLHTLAVAGQDGINEVLANVGRRMRRGGYLDAAGSAALFLVSVALLC